MSAEHARCANCGKRLPRHAHICPLCGYENVIHTPRIRCNYCGRRIPATFVVCPNCKHNPRSFYWRRSPIIWVVLLALIALLVCGILNFGSFGGSVNGLSEINTTLTPSPTFAPVTVVIVATNRPITATRVPPTLTKTASPTPVPPSLTSTPTLTPTRVVRTPRATDTPTMTSTPAPIAAPALVSPTNQEHVGTINRNVDLSFHPNSVLGPQDWYRVQVDFLDRSDNPVSWCGWTKQSSIGFPRGYFDDSSPNVRSFLWHISIVHTSDPTPATCEAPFTKLSAQSDVWTFFWYP